MNESPYEMANRAYQARRHPAHSTIEESTPKFCVNCKHYRLAREQPPGSEHRCSRVIFNLVTGKETKLDVICDVERGFSGDCRPAGNFWEPMGA